MHQWLRISAFCFYNPPPRAASGVVIARLFEPRPTNKLGRAVGQILPVAVLFHARYRQAHDAGDAAPRRFRELEDRHIPVRGFALSV